MTASSLALDKLQLELAAQIQVQVRDNRLRSTRPLRKLGCDMGLAAHRATGALGRLCGVLARISRAAAVANFGVAWAARHLLQA